MIYEGLDGINRQPYNGQNIYSLGIKIDKF